MHSAATCEVTHSRSVLPHAVPVLNECAVDSGARCMLLAALTHMLRQL